MHDIYHTCCGVYVATEAHNGSTATCVCGAKHGETIPHTDADEDDLCDICGIDISEGLSAGAIVGISIGSVAVAGVGGFSIFWFVIKKKAGPSCLV